MYTTRQVDSTGNPTGYAKIVQAFLETLLSRYEVDIYFAGHVHSYERSYPVFQGQRTPGSTVHIVQGAAGNVEGHDTPTGVAPWLAYFNKVDYGYGTLTVQNNTCVHWAFYRANDNSIADQVEICKP